MSEQRNKIYKTKRWEDVRQAVLRMDHYECQRCNGKVFPIDTPPKKTKATLVHHIFNAKAYPEYRYSPFVEKNGKKARNLVSLCFDCHEIIHGRRKSKENERFTTEERYD